MRSRRTASIVISCLLMLLVVSTSVGADPIRQVTTSTLPPSAWCEALAPDANVRAAPALDAPRVGSIAPGTTYPVVGQFMDWFAIIYPAYPDDHAWVHMNVVQVSGDIALIPHLVPPLDAYLQAALDRATTFSGGNDDWEPFTWEFDSVPMVLVPAGCFMMGSTAEQIDVAFEMCQQDQTLYECERRWFDDETPAHVICFDQPFWIDKYEVSNDQYGEPTTKCKSFSWEPGQPRVCVNWADARDYCAARGARLPTEAEWEYAARGPDAPIFPWGDLFRGDWVNFCDVNCEYDDRRNTAYDDHVRRIARVWGYPQGASWVGALNMIGNVWEWTSTNGETDFTYPYVADDGREDLTDTSVDRVLRGGSYAMTSYVMRAANRHPDLGSWHSNGMRCVRSVDEP